MGRFRAVVIGASAGGLNALSTLLAHLPRDFPLAVATVQHVSPGRNACLAEILDEKCALRVSEAEERETALGGQVCIAPPDSHLFVERDGTFSLSIDEKVNHSRPSIDVLFESAAYAWGPVVIGVVLSGASADGAQGLRLIRSRGGVAIVQDPATAEHPVMPQAAMDAEAVGYVVQLEEIGGVLISLATGSAIPTTPRTRSDG